MLLLFIVLIPIMSFSNESEVVKTTIRALSKTKFYEVAEEKTIDRVPESMQRIAGYAYGLASGKVRLRSGKSEVKVENYGRSFYCGIRIDF